MTEVDRYKKVYTLNKNPDCLIANPHYNYTNRMFFGDDGIVSIYDGKKNSINLIAQGKYKFVFNNNTIGKLYIKLENTNLIKINFIVEGGPFYLNNEIIYNWNDKIYVAQKKYVFNVDPIRICNESKNNNLISRINYKYDDLDERIYYESIETKTVTDFDEQDIEFTKNGYFKLSFSKFNNVSNYEDVYEDLINNCDYVDEMVNENLYDTDDTDDDYNTKSLFDDISTRINMNHDSKILTDIPTEVVAYYDKNIEILGYYILETINYFSDDYNVSFNIMCIHSLEILPDIENNKEIFEDMICNINNTLHNEYSSFTEITAIILPNIYIDIVSRFKELNFENNDKLHKEYESKIKLLYEELYKHEFYEFDLEYDIILYNTNLELSEKVNE